MTTPRIVAIPGSLRRDSFNRKLVALGAAALREAGAEVDVVDLKELALPVYDGDIESAGMPAGALVLKDRIAGASGLFVSTPEYNHGVPGALKNAIDWASRGGSNPFQGKWAALTSASPGGFGGMRGLAALRPTLTCLGAYLLPRELNLSRAGEAFRADGSLVDRKTHDQLVALMTALVERLR
ncbi:MAG: NAD(P)H-dependent oxidoreductase [bacterium]